MFYIPDDWLQNKSNMSKVRAIMNQHLFSDINPNLETLFSELERIGEGKIIEKIKDGTIRVD